MNAKEMFEKSGFSLEDQTDIYTKRFVKSENEYGYKVIDFDLADRTYFVKSISASGWSSTAWITENLHNAIHQQMKELGWIE